MFPKLEAMDANHRDDGLEQRRRGSAQQGASDCTCAYDAAANHDHLQGFGSEAVIGRKFGTDIEQWHEENI